MSMPEAKRRKVLVVTKSAAPPALLMSEFGTEIRLDGTITPCRNDTPATDDMDTEMTPNECPCGHLHGPGVGHFHDISAVGFSADVMRGPD